MSIPLQQEFPEERRDRHRRPRSWEREAFHEALRHEGEAQRSSVSLRLMNGFSIVIQGRPIDLPMSAQRLVAFLALQDRPMLRTYVSGTLWPDSHERHAAANLRSAIWRVHQACPTLIDATRSRLELGGCVTVDVARMMNQATRLLDPRSNLPAEPVDLHPFAADLLPDWYDEWAVLERERLRQVRLHGLEALCRRLTLAGRLGEAIQAGLAAVAAEPLRESARRILMQAHLAEGNWGEALRQYTSFRRLLFDELGMDPSWQMDDLVRTLRA